MSAGVLILYACGLLAALMWWGEELSKFATFACVVSVCALAHGILVYSRKHNACTNANFWFQVFGLRLLISTILVGSFWQQSDLTHRSESGFDPIRWDYAGAELADSGLVGTHDVGRSGKNGLIYYIGFIYSVFGISCIYITWFNALIALGTLLLLSFFLYSHFGPSPRWDYMAFGLLIPEYLWYSSLALKEVHNGFLFVLFMICIAQAFFTAKFSKTQKWYLLLFLCVLGVTVFQSMHIVTLGLFAVLAFGLKIRFRRRYTGLILTLGLMGLAMASQSFRAESTLEAERESEIMQAALTSGLSADRYQDIGGSINSLLIGNNFIERIAFSIPRTFFFAITPFPRLDFWSPWGNRIYDWAAMNATTSRLSVILFLILSPALIGACTQIFKHNSRISIAKLPFLLYFCGLLAMANGVMMFHERWRSSLWPIWLAIILIGWPYRKRYYWVFPVAGGSGILLFGAFKYLF